MILATLVAVAALAAGLALDEIFQARRPRNGRAVLTDPLMTTDLELAGRGVYWIGGRAYIAAVNND